MGGLSAGAPAPSVKSSVGSRGQDHCVDTTPVWVPLAVAGLGLLGTITAGIAGVVITQRRSDRREDTVWARERERERQRWEREDQARTFEQRRQAYADFYESLKTMAKRAYDHGFGFTDEPELPADWQWETFRRLQRLELYADQPVAQAAWAAYSAAWHWGMNTSHGDADDPKFHDSEGTYDAAEAELLVAVRRSLSIPDAEKPRTP